MKKALSVLLAFVLLVACCFTVSAEVTEAKAPTNYLWVKTEDAANPSSITYTITLEDLKGNTDFRVFADIMFEDVVANDGGVAFVNLYSYNEAGELIEWTDWATQNTEGVVQGKWATMDYNWTVPEGFAYATLSIGCWNATGTVNIGAINLSCNKEMIVNIAFSTGVDLNAENVSGNNVNADNQGINWDVVLPEVDEPGFVNIAKDCPVYIFGNSDPSKDGDEAKSGHGIYHGRLTDGVVPEPGLIGDWFGFNHGANVMDKSTTSIDGISGRGTGRIRIDLGEEKDFNKVRVNFWGPQNLQYGVCRVAVMKAYYGNSENFAEATPFADILFDTTADSGWGATNEQEITTARYVFVEILFDGTTWGMISEIQVLSPELIEDPEESSEEPSVEEPSKEESKEESKPAEESKEESKPAPTPKTGDAGMIALAVVSVITLAGVVIVKKSR